LGTEHSSISFNFPLGKDNQPYVPTFSFRIRQLYQVNKIREIPQYPSLIVTHTDAPEVLLWNVEKQQHRPREKVRWCTAGCMLFEHTF
jgi:hypothetical protein